MSLTDDFQQVKGIGPSKADELAEIAAQSDTSTSDNVEQAYAYLQEGHYSYAEKYLRKELQE